MSDYLREFDDLVDPLIEKDFKDLSVNAKNNLKWLIKYSGGDRKKILKNLNEIISYARGLKFAINNLEEEGYDPAAALKKGKVKVAFNKKKK